jgi:hypothetical protein
VPTPSAISSPTRCYPLACRRLISCASPVGGAVRWWLAMQLRPAPTARSPTPVPVAPGTTTMGPAFSGSRVPDGYRTYADGAGEDPSGGATSGAGGDATRYTRLGGLPRDDHG